MDRRSRAPRGPARAAVFDLDNTLVRGSSLFHFGVLLARRREVAWHQVLRHAGAEASYVIRRREPDGIGPTVAARALGVASGMSQGRILDLAQEFAEERLRDRLVPEVHLQVRDLRQAGYLTLLATASPQELASAIAARLRMDGAIGTEAEVRDGRYTGRLAGPLCHGAEKARRVAAVLRERGIDPRECLAFSDSVNDVPLLALVGHPVATNPDPELQRIARANGWWILRSSPADDAHPEVSPPAFPHPY